jgi:hypothetical protein
VRKTAVCFTLLFILAAIARLAHSGILWAEEGLPLATARHMLAGRALYLDIWFDKPPLLAAAYLLWAAQAGWILRVAGALYVTLASWIAYRFVRDLWGVEAGLWSAALLAFFLTFDIASAVMPLASDLLMLAPHLAAVWMAWRGRAFWSGVLAGAAFLISSKGIFVLAACALWSGRALPLLLAGFAVPNGIALLWLWWNQALVPWFDEVWRWGRLYAGSTFVGSPMRNGLERTLHWAGFHGGVLAAAGIGLWHDKHRWKFLAWAAISLIALAAGGRFFPRYFFQLLPVAVIGAGAFYPGRTRTREALVLVWLLIPLVRFGPQYVDLLRRGPAPWRDVAMDQDSRQAARMARKLTAPSDTIQVWGFRPELYVYSDRLCASRFLDSQPLTGVPADRHLTDAKPVAAEWARANRAELMRSRPALILDGLGPYNPPLAISNYPDLQPWLADYQRETRSAGVIIYVRKK